MKLKFSTASLQHEFTHAEDFGVFGNWNSHSGRLFQGALEEFMRGPATEEYRIQFRGALDYRVSWINGREGSDLRPDGNFRAVWELGAEQGKGVVVHGKLW